MHSVTGVVSEFLHENVWCVNGSVAAFHGLFPLGVFDGLALVLLSCDISCECVRR